MDKHKLDADSQDQLDRRTENGRYAIETHPTFEANEEPETVASDLISDILTALYGPAGTHSVGGSLTPNHDAIEKANELIARAFVSWTGDAEDYTEADDGSR